MRRRSFLGGVAALGTAGGVAALSAPVEVGLAVGDGTRGEGSPVSVTRRVSDDDVTYLPERDEVRYVSASAGGEPLRYRTEPFDRWARRRCAAAGAERVLPTIRERLSGPVDGVGSGVESRWFGTVVNVDHTTELDGNREPESTPSVGFEELVTVTPRYVTATVRLEEAAYTRDVPVAVQRVEMQADPALSK